MQFIQNKIFITLEEYACSTNQKRASLGALIRQRRRLYKSIESTYQSTDSGRVILYQLDSLPEVHQKQVRAWLGLEARVSSGDGEERVAEEPESKWVLCPSSSLQAEIVGSRLLPDEREIPKLVRLVAWLEMLRTAPRANGLMKYYSKEFAQAWEVNRDRYTGEWQQDLIYGELIRNGRQMSEKIRLLDQQGWRALISKKYGNQNKSLVKGNPELIRALKILAIQPSRPTWEELEYQIGAFLRGAMGDLLNPDTGEVISWQVLRASCLDKQGQVRYPDKSTIYKHLWLNQASKLFLLENWGGVNAAAGLMPSHKRRRGDYSLSQCSMDDRHEPFKINIEGKDLWSYVVIDNLSEYPIGFAFTLARKSVDAWLPKEALRNALCNPMLRGKLPIEIQVERRLNKENAYFADAQGIPMVKFELKPNGKRIERMFKDIRQLEKKELKGFKGRPWARNPKNLQPKNYNEVQKNPVWDYGELKEMLTRLYLVTWGEALHSDQEGYPGKTRKQVFEENINPDAPAAHWPSIARYLGESVTSSVYRNSRIKAFGKEWKLPYQNELQYTQLMEQLEGQEVRVCRLPEFSEKVWVVQGESIWECAEYSVYNAFTAERTEEDWEVFETQQKQLEAVKKSLKKQKETSKGFVISTGDLAARQAEEPEDYYDKLLKIKYLSTTKTTLKNV